MIRWTTQPSLPGNWGALRARFGVSRSAVRTVFRRSPSSRLHPMPAEPFPTTYYLTCPWLVASIARLEAAGGVERWSLAAQSDPVLADSLARADADQRRIRPSSTSGSAARVTGRR